MSPVARLRRSPPPLLCRNARHPRSSSACGQSRAVPKPPGCPLPPALDHACVYGNCHREGLGRCAGGRRLDKCPPSSAFGGRLLLYFVQTPATRAAARLADSREPQPGPPGCLTREGRGACVRSKGGGAGRRPAPGDIRTQAPLPPALDHACVYGNCHREGLGRCAGGRRLVKCPPSSAFGGRLLLYFVQTPATRAAARLADSREPQPGPPGCLTRGGRGACVRSKGGGDGRRPAPGDIRTQAPLPHALDQPAFLLDDAKKKRGPDVPEAAPGEKMPWKGRGIRTRS